MSIIYFEVFFLATILTDSCGHVLSGESRPGQPWHLAFMQQDPDSSMAVVHHRKTPKRPDSVVHHVKPSKTGAAAHHMRQPSQSGPDQDEGQINTWAWMKTRGMLWLSSRVCIVLAIVSLCLCFGFARFRLGKCQSIHEFVASIPTVASPADMQVGTWVKITGTVTPIDEDEPLKSILEGRPCVFSEAHADVPESSVTVARFETTCDLQIVSDKGNADVGPVLVHASDSAVLKPKAVLDAIYVRKLMPPDFEDFVKNCPTPGHSGEESLALHALQFHERILEVNARVAIIGVVSVSSSGKLCLVPDTVAHLEKTRGCRQAFRRNMQSLLSSADAQFMSSHVVVIDEKKVEDQCHPVTTQHGSAQS